MRAQERDGIVREGTCPECGQAVARSFDVLPVEDPVWLGRLAWGVRQFYWLAPLVLGRTWQATEGRIAE